MSAKRSCVSALVLVSCSAALGACSTVHLKPAPPRTPRAPRENAAIRDLRRIAAEDLNCEPNRIEVSRAGRVWGVAGCSKRTTYARLRDGQRRWTRTEPIAPRTPTEEAVLVVSKSAQGQTTLNLRLPHPGTDLVLRLVARPAAYPDKALLSFERPLTLASMEQCEARVQVQGTPLALPLGTFRREQLLESRLFELPMRDVVALAEAQNATAELCGKQVELVQADFLKLRELVAQVEAELASVGPALPAAEPDGAQIAAPSTPVLPAAAEGEGAESR